MKRVLKWLGAVPVLLAVVLLIGFAVGSARLSRTYRIPERSVTVPTDQESIELGGHWVAVFCVECHAEDLGGKVFFEDATIGIMNAPNLTTGEGGASAGASM